VKKRFILIVAILIIAIAYVKGLSYGGEAKSSADKKVDGIFASFITKSSPGGSVIIIKDGKILYKSAYGMADIKKKIPVTTKTLFHLGSTGKQFTALAVLMLLEKGKLKLDDPIGKYLPQLKRFKNITIRRLLNHTSGIPDYTEDEDLMDELFELRETPDNEDALKLLSSHGKLLFTPGEKFFYSNTGYDMLGSLIEHVSGQAFPVFMEKRIFAPLNMNNTFSLPDKKRFKKPNLAHCYIKEDGEIDSYDSDPLDDLAGSGSVYSTVEDMYLYDKALYTDKLVKQSTLSEAFKPAKLNNGKTYPYGFGWILGTHKGKKYICHDGYWLAFMSYYIRFPEDRLSVIILLNRDYDLPEEELDIKIAELYL